jgi:hypothetical protein
MLSFTSRLSFAAAAFIAVVACTTKHTEIRSSGSGSPDGGGGGGAGTGPEIDASKLGGACSGFGTGIGQTAAFESEDCAAGICLVDAREGLSLYCSADCASASCPSGWECKAVDLGAAEHACFKVPGGQEEDGGTTDAAVASGLDAPLTGYEAGAKSTSTFSIASFKDPSQVATDLIVLVVSGSWSIYDQKLMEDLESASFTKTVIVSVLVEGGTVGKGATASDLATWHSEYPKHAKVLDASLAKLGGTIGALAPGEIEAFPTLIALDASSLKEVGRQAGYEAPAALEATIEGWRAKTK